MFAVISVYICVVLSINVFTNRPVYEQLTFLCIISADYIYIYAKLCMLNYAYLDKNEYDV